VLLVGSQTDLVVAYLEVELGELASSSQFIEEFVDNGKQILSLDGQYVQMPVIHDKSPSLVPLANE
jgi:hypothetical protein